MVVFTKKFFSEETSLDFFRKLSVVNSSKFKEVMDMKIYNAMTRRKEEFIPIEGKNVRMYACGITVYDLCHIGHARQAIVYAMIADYLRYRGYNVKYVRNYTDVDDKIIQRANMLGKNAIDF